MLSLLAGALIGLLSSAHVIAWPVANYATCTVANYIQTFDSVPESVHGHLNPGPSSATFWNYTITIGVPYNKSACDAFSTDAGETGVPPLGLQCFEVWADVLYMNFYSGKTDESANQAVVLALSKAYPSVPFLEDKICLAEGYTAPASWPTPTPSSG